MHSYPEAKLYTQRTEQRTEKRIKLEAHARGDTRAATRSNRQQQQREYTGSPSNRHIAAPGYESTDLYDSEGMPQNYIRASTVQLLDTYQRCCLKRKHCDEDSEDNKLSKHLHSGSANTTHPVKNRTIGSVSGAGGGQHTSNTLLDSKGCGKVPRGARHHHQTGILPHGAVPHGTMAGNNGETIKSSSSKV